MSVQQIGGCRFFVTSGRHDCVVDLEHVKCACGVYGIEKISCSHAIAPGSFANLNIATLVCLLYSTAYLYAGYPENIYPSVGVVEPHKCLQKKSMVRGDKRSQDGNLGWSCPG